MKTKTILNLEAKYFFKRIWVFVYYYLLFLLVIYDCVFSLSFPLEKGRL